MKRFAKIIKYTAIVIFLFIISLISIAEFAEKPITKLALNQIEKTFGASISIESIDFSLLKDFPHAQLDLKNVILKGDSVEQPDIMVLQHAYVSVKMLPLLENKIEIIQLELENGQANYQVNKNNTTNISFLIPESTPKENTTDTLTSNLAIIAPLIKTSGIKLRYNDELQNTSATVILDAITSVFIQEETGTSANVSGTIIIKGVNYPETKAALMNQTTIDLNAKFLNDTVHLEEVRLLSDGVQLSASGWMGTTGNFSSELKVYNTRFDLKELSKYIPDTLITNYNLNISGGILSTEAYIQGDLLDTLALPHLNASVKIENGQLAALDYPAIKQFDAEVSFTNGAERSMASSELLINQLVLNTANSQVQLNAKAQNFDHPMYTFESKININLDEFKHLIPENLRTDVSGNIQASVSNKGMLPDSVNMTYINETLNNSKAQLTFKNFSLAMDSVINLQKLNGSASFQNKSLKLNNISCQLPEYKLSISPSNIQGKYSGNLDNIDHLTLSIDTLNLIANNSQIAGQVFIKNASKPEYRIHCNTHINLKDWSAFIPDTLLKEYGGELIAEINSEGSFNPDSIQDEAMRLMFKHSTIDLRSKDLALSTPDELIDLKSFNGRVYMANDSILLEDISGNFNQTSFSIDSTSISKLYNSFLLNQKDTVRVLAFAQLGNLDYDMINKFIPEDNAGTNDSTETTPSPSNYAFDIMGKFGIDQFKYNKAILKNISGLYHLTDSLYIVDQLKVDGFKGSTNSSLKVQLMANELRKINFKTQVHGLDINQLLVDFDDFKNYTEEVYISHNQLSGYLSTDNLNGEITYLGDSLDMNIIKLTTDIKLENGRLHDYPMTKEMGKDYNIDDLDDLQFKTVDTKLFVYKGAVYAPLTNIKTNTFDISLFGMQNFNMDCQYHLRFYLKEILRKGKTDRIERKQANEKKQKDDGGTKGLSSLFAIYKVENGKTVKSTLEGKDSKERRDMERSIKNKEAIYEFYFNPKLVKYNTGIKN